MTAQTNTEQVEYLRRPQAASFCGISQALLRKLERNGAGPRRCFLGRAVVYPVVELRQFMQERLNAQ